MNYDNPNPSAPVFIPQPSAPPPVYIQVEKKSDKNPIYLFDTQEYFTEDEKTLNSIARVFNTIYRACYKGFFLFMLFLNALAIPFIGMSAGILDAAITIHARPFVRPIGKLMAEIFGHNKGHYLNYMNNAEKSV